MEQAPRFVQLIKENYVCKVRKELYGLKQGPSAWYIRIDEYFREVGFKRSNIDLNLYRNAILS